MFEDAALQALQIAEGDVRDMLLFVIALLLGGIGWGLRKWYKDLSETLTDLHEQLESNRTDIDRNQVSIFGKENTPWDGYNQEITQNRRALRDHRTALEQHEEQLERHAAALSREEMIDRAVRPEDQTTRNMEDIPPLGPHVGGSTGASD